MLTSRLCLISLKKAHAIISILFLLIAYPASAKKDMTIEACEKSSKKNIDLSACLDQVKSHAEKELKTWVNNQVFILEELSKVTGRSASLKIFKRSQSTFEEFREDNCRWQYLQIAPATGAASAYKKCYIKHTRQRSLELKSLSK